MPLEYFRKLCASMTEEERNIISKEIGKRHAYEFSIDFKARGNFTVLAEDRYEAENLAQEEASHMLNSFEAGELNGSWDIDFVKRVDE